MTDTQGNNLHSALSSLLSFGGKSAYGENQGENNSRKNMLEMLQNMYNSNQADINFMDDNNSTTGSGQEGGSSGIENIAKIAKIIGAIAALA